MESWLQISSSHFYHSISSHHFFLQTEAVQNCSVEAHISTDFGRSWSFLESYVVQFSWGRKSLPEEIFMVRYERPVGNQRFGAWDKDADFFRSSDLWKTNTKLIPHGNRYLLLGNYLFVAAVNPDKTNEVQIVVAKEESMVYEVGRLPFELREHSYTILDTSEGFSPIPHVPSLALTRCGISPCEPW